jgi:hypothetical protein
MYSSNVRMWAFNNITTIEDESNITNSNKTHSSMEYQGTTSGIGSNIGTHH